MSSEAKEIAAVVSCSFCPPVEAIRAMNFDQLERLILSSHYRGCEICDLRVGEALLGDFPRTQPDHVPPNEE